MTKRIDNVLAYLRKSVPANDRLKHLESDVWARIVAEKSEQPVGFFEGLLASIFPAQHRFAPVIGLARWSSYSRFWNIKKSFRRIGVEKCIFNGCWICLIKFSTRDILNMPLGVLA